MRLLHLGVLLPVSICELHGMRFTDYILIHQRRLAKQSWPLRLWQFPPSPLRRLMLTWVMSTVNSGPKVICMS